MEKPSRALLVRSFQKDGIYLQHLQSILRGIFDPFIGGDNERRNRVHLVAIIETFSKLIYYMSTTARALQTIGEEYTSLIAVRRRRFAETAAGGAGGHSNQLTTVPTSLVLNLYAIMQSSSQAFTRILIDLSMKYLRLYRNASVERVHQLRILLNSLLAAIGALNSALFYLTGQGYKLAQRFLGISYVSIASGSSGDHFSTALFKIIGIINLIRSISDIRKTVQHLIQLSTASDIDVSTIQNSSSASPDQKIGASKCSLCLENPCVSPTAAVCGHVFCWECIIDSTRVVIFDAPENLCQSYTISEKEEIECFAEIQCQPEFIKYLKTIKNQFPAVERFINWISRGNVSDSLSKNNLITRSKNRCSKTNKLESNVFRCLTPKNENINVSNENISDAYNNISKVKGPPKDISNLKQPIVDKKEKLFKKRKMSQLRHSVQMHPLKNEADSTTFEIFHLNKLKFL